MALVLVQPETVLRWHHDWLRRRWTRRATRTRCGRLPISREIRAVIREMATANPLWGAPRIHGELAKLGVEVSVAGARGVRCGGGLDPRTQGLRRLRRNESTP